MPRGVTTLETMVRDLRYETHRSADPNIGLDEYPSLCHLLERVQKTLYWDFDWPFLKIRADITLVAGQRYYNVPSDIDFERIISFRGNGNDYWKPIIRGIGMEHYEIYDSDNDERGYPTERWDVWNTGSGEQLEIWPMPDQSGETIRISAFKKLAPLVADNDVCTLDNDLIVLFAAAELMASQDAQKATAKLNLANKLFAKLRGGSVNTEGSSFVMGSRPPVAKDLGNIHNNPQILAVKTPST